MSFRPEAASGMPSLEELAKIQRERHSVRMRHSVDFAATDLLTGNVSSEEAKNNKISEAQERAHAREAFGQELVAINTIIAKAEAELAPLEALVATAQAKLAASRPEAKRPYQLAIEQSQGKIAELKTKLLYGEENLEGLRASREALQTMLTTLAPEDNQSH